MPGGAGDPNDPKWKKENRDPKDRGTTPARKHERDEKAEPRDDVAEAPEND